MSFNILIVEDELMIAEMIKEMLQELEYHVLGIAKNYQDAENKFKAFHETTNLIILDINLSDHKNGIDIGSLIKQNYQIPFVYLTSYSDPQTIKNAAETKPAAYLLKPFTSGDLYATVEVIKARKESIPQKITIKESDLNIKLDISDIHYVKSDNIYLEIFTTKRKYLIRNSLDRFIEEMDNSIFLRVHRSYAVNLNQIQAINGQYILVNDSKIPISRKHKEDLMKRLEKE